MKRLALLAVVAVALAGCITPNPPGDAPVDNSARVTHIQVSATSTNLDADPQNEMALDLWGFDDNQSAWPFNARVAFAMAHQCAPAPCDSEMPKNYPMQLAAADFSAGPMPTYRFAVDDPDLISGARYEITAHVTLDSGLSFDAATTHFHSA